MIACKECGTENPSTNRFCIKCGAELPVAATAPTGGQQNAGGQQTAGSQQTAGGYSGPPIGQVNTPAFGAMGSTGMVWRQDQLVGFGTRFVAVLIDGIILFIIDAILTALHVPALQWIVALLYFGYFWSTTGQTVGDLVMKIRVARTDGQPLSSTTGILRAVGYYISVVALCIGVLWVLWDPNKQGWHDKIANTVVVRAQ